MPLQAHSGCLYRLMLNVFVAALCRLMFLKRQVSGEGWPHLKGFVFCSL